jgi:hypothetical protein
VGEVVMGRCEFGLTGVMIDGGARFEGEGGFIDRFDKVAAETGLRSHIVITILNVLSDSTK